MNKNSKIIYIVAGIILVILIVVMFLKPKSNNDSVDLIVLCTSETRSGVYKTGDSFKCKVAGSDYTITITEITNDTVKLQSDKYGLFPRRDDGTISLTERVKDFTLEKNKTLDLALQATDLIFSIKIKMK